ncbi:hypothetical protein F5884DRAFT_784265 [Xylogone sp. PMI_703]|nr:hypothetical protein F5884DRAFT_784265 [Xylogone sp. PMI_703]
MADDILLTKIHDLSDLELATLICLVAQEHCVITTDTDAIDDVAQELQLIAAKVFGLTHAVVNFTEHTSLDEFAHAILSVDESSSRSTSPIRTRQDSFLHHNSTFRSITRSPAPDSFAFDNKSIASILILKNLDEAPRQVQLQTLELIRTKRLFTRTSVHAAPKRFMIIALLTERNGPSLTKHLNEHMFISHFHDPEDGFPNIDEADSDTESSSSVVKKSYTKDMLSLPAISPEDIDQLIHLSERIIFSIEVKQYMINIISFLRLHRAVGGGITPAATQHFEKLAKLLASLHGLTFVTPSLVALAARKVYLHRIQIVRPEHDRSMQWGSNLEVVREVLEGVCPEDVIEDVLGLAGPEVPL